MSADKLTTSDLKLAAKLAEQLSQQLRAADAHPHAVVCAAGMLLVGYAKAAGVTLLGTLQMVGAVACWCETALDQEEDKP